MNPRLFIIGFVLLFMAQSCQKTTTSANTTNPVKTYPIVPATNLDTLEQKLVGNWKLDSTANYANYIYAGSSVATDPNKCILQLKAEFYHGDTAWYPYHPAYNAIYGLSCDPGESSWGCGGGKLNMGIPFSFGGTSYYVTLPSPNKLILKYDGFILGQYSLYYLHK